MWKYFWAKKELFLCRHGELRKQLSLFQKTCMRVLLWGMETLALSQKMMEQLDAEYTKMVEKMMNIKRDIRAGESWLEWSIRRVRAARHIIVTSPEGTASSQYLSKYFGWSGHLARFDDGRWAYTSTSWKSL